jgi:hypothetical protein
MHEIKKKTANENPAQTIKTVNDRKERKTRGKRDREWIRNRF